MCNFVPVNSRFYKYVKLFKRLRSPRLKYLTMLVAHLSGMRYAGVYLDPVMACNIRCRMCYFSSPADAPKPQAPLSAERLALVSRAFFGRALRLQIGCGAEPTLYRHLDDIIAEGSRRGVKSIEITSNGQLLRLDDLRRYASKGLTGITLSLHGTTAATYEYLMQGARFERLRQLIADLRQLQIYYPDFQVRINYTFNKLNVDEMRGIPELFSGVRLSALQMRPVQKLGDTAYNEFDLEDVIARYDTLVVPLIDYCRRNGVQCLVPTVDNLRRVDKTADTVSSFIEKVAYVYVSSENCYHDDFDLTLDTFDSYHRRNGLWRRLLGGVLKGRIDADTRVRRTKKMNYDIQ